MKRGDVVLLPFGRSVGSGSMGLVIYPVYQKPVPDNKTETTGEFLAAEFEVIDEIAEEHGLTPITAFADQLRSLRTLMGHPGN